VAKTKKKSTTQKLIDKYGRQAVAEAFLRFNPEASGLRQSLADIGAQEKQGVGSARSVFASVRGATAKARPQLDKIFGDQATLAKALQDAAPASVTGPAGGASAIEREGAARRLGEQLANAKAETTSRDQEAASGMAFQIGNVQARAAADRSKVQTRLAELDREQGAFIQGRVASLDEARRKREATARENARNRAATRANQEDQQSFQAGENQKNRDAKTKNGSRTKPKDSGAYVDTRDAVNAALRHAKALRKGGVGRNQALDTLVTGRESQTIPSGQTRINPATGKPVETSLKLPAIPKTKRTFAQIAVELAWTGKISAQSARRLRALGYSVKTLGYHVQKPAKPKRGGFADPGVYKTS